MIFGISWKDILAFIGGLAVILGFIKLLFDVTPKLNSFKSNVFRELSVRIKHSSLEKRAIANNIEDSQQLCFPSTKRIT